MLSLSNAHSREKINVLESKSVKNNQKYATIKTKGIRGYCGQFYGNFIWWLNRNKVLENVINQISSRRTR